MSLVYWVFVCCFVTVAHAVPFMPGLMRTVHDFVDGRWTVKGKLMFEGWLKAGERWLNSGSNAPKRGRWASIKYETLRTGFDFSGEDFQNLGTFMVVKSSVFSTSSAYKTHLARDAYHAFWREVRRRQVQFFQWLNFRIKTGAKVVTSDDGISVSDVRKEMHCG